MSQVNEDFSDFVAALKHNDVEFVVVGAFALAFLGFPRATGDIDFWIRPTEGNAEGIIRALKDFGFDSLGISKEDILSGKVIQMGYPPARIDLLTSLSGVTSDEIWNNRKEGAFGKHVVFYLDQDTFLKNKRAADRSKDKIDVALFEKPAKPKKEKGR